MAAAGQGVRPGAHTGPPGLAGTDGDATTCAAVADRWTWLFERSLRLSASVSRARWEASLVGPKLYAFPGSFGKEHAAALVAERVAALAGGSRRLAAGDTSMTGALLATRFAGYGRIELESASLNRSWITVITVMRGGRCTSEWLGLPRGAVFRDQGCFQQIPAQASVIMVALGGFGDGVLGSQSSSGRIRSACA